MKSISKELIGAGAPAIILSLLKIGDSYGYEIIHKVKEMTDDKIKWAPASIYPVLKKMENGRLIKSYWKHMENDRPRKYYTILEEGEKQFKLYREEVELIYSVLVKLWEN